MTQSAIDSMPYSLPLLKLKRTWSVGSVVASITAVLVSILVFALTQTETSQMVLVVAIGMLLVLVLLHTRFLAYAQGESRETNALLSTKERESISIFEHTQDAILVLDDDGICQSANPSAGTFFSMPPAKMIGQSMRAFFADEDAFESIRSEFGGNHSNQGEVELVRATGATVFAEFTTAAHFLPRRHLVILRDATTRRRAQEAVRQSLMVARSSWQQAETMRQASLALTEDRRMNSVLDSLLATLAQFVPYGRAQLFLLETDRLFLAREAVSSSKANIGPSFPEIIPLSDYPLFKKVLEAQEGLFIQYLSCESISKQLGNDSPTVCFIGVPIASSRQILGLLSLTGIPGELSSGHLAHTRSLATLAAVAIENARLYESAQIYGAELERSLTRLRRAEGESQGFQSENLTRNEWFETIFRSTPVGLSLSSLADGTFLLTNKTFERSFGILEDPWPTEVTLWEDPRERSKLIDRLGRGVRVRSAVARLRQRSGSYHETMYSAEKIEVEGQPYLLLATEDRPDPNH